MKNRIFFKAFIIYFLLNNFSYAYDQNINENTGSKYLEQEIFLNSLNTIVLTAHAFQSGSESATDVSPACQNVGESASFSLNSRTSFCQKFTKELDLYDAEGNTVNTANIIGYVYAEDNATNVLKWPVKFRFRTVYTNPIGPIAYVAPKLECGTEDGSNNCNTLGAPTVVLNPGLSSEVIVDTDMNMYSNNEKEFPMLIQGKYNLVGQSLFDSNARNFEDGNIPVVRCDIGLAKANTRGCIFLDAPAVLRTININIPEVTESAQHIRDAQNSGLPGKYVPLQNSIIADSSVSAPLTRLRDYAQRNINRKYSLSICKAQDNTYSENCAPSGDPDDPLVSCQCDEYPFAATNEGGATLSSPGVSARKITPSDNMSAGGRLGAFFNQQRVLDGENFYVNVE